VRASLLSFFVSRRRAPRSRLPPFSLSATPFSPLTGWQFLRHDYPRNLSSANARTVFPAVRPMLRLPPGRTSTYTRARTAACIYKCDLPQGRAKLVRNRRVDSSPSERASAIIREMVRNIWVKARTVARAAAVSSARHRRPRRERN